jgi:hypothetical protein
LDVWFGGTEADETNAYLCENWGLDIFGRQELGFGRKLLSIFERIMAWIFWGSKTPRLGGNYCLSLRESCLGYSWGSEAPRVEQELEEIIVFFAFCCFCLLIVYLIDKD